MSKDVSGSLVDINPSEVSFGGNRQHLRVDHSSEEYKDLQKQEIGRNEVDILEPLGQIYQGGNKEEWLIWKGVERRRKESQRRRTYIEGGGC